MRKGFVTHELLVAIGLVALGISITLPTAKALIARGHSPWRVAGILGGAWVLVLAWWRVLQWFERRNWQRDLRKSDSPERRGTSGDRMR